MKKGKIPVELMMGLVFVAVIAAMILIKVLLVK